MDAMLGYLDFAVAYLHDIMIRSRNRVEHAKHVKLVFKNLKEYGLKLSIDKFDKYLGHIIYEKGRKPNTAKAAAIKICFHQLVY